MPPKAATYRVSVRSIGLIPQSRTIDATSLGAIHLRNREIIRIDGELALLAIRARLSAKLVAVGHLGRPTLRARRDWRFQVVHEFGPAPQAQIRRVVSRAAIPFLLRVVCVVFLTPFVDVVRVAVVPSFDSLATAFAHETFALRHNRILKMGQVRKTIVAQ